MGIFRMFFFFLVKEGSQEKSDKADGGCVDGLDADVRRAVKDLLKDFVSVASSCSEKWVKRAVYFTIGS